MQFSRAFGQAAALFANTPRLGWRDRPSSRILDAPNRRCRAPVTSSSSSPLVRSTPEEGSPDRRSRLSLSGLLDAAAERDADRPALRDQSNREAWTGRPPFEWSYG